METRSQLNVTISRELHMAFKNKSIREGVCMNEIIVALVRQYVELDLSETK